ncbi:MAG: LamG-like jellyroll fold domain-containing protein, partial [Nocardioides sp.]
IEGTVTDNRHVASVRVQLQRSVDNNYLQDDLTSWLPTPNDLPASVTGTGTARASFTFDAGVHNAEDYSIAVLATDSAGRVNDAFSVVSVSPTPPAPGQVIYQMNEAAGATTMADTGGNGLTGVVDPAAGSAGLTTGAIFDGAAGYYWAYRPPATSTTAPGRVVQVPDNYLLDAGNDTFSVEIRYRTSHSFGNIVQKGQAATAGGQWKIQAPGGQPSCLFKSSPGTSQQIAVKSTRDLSDNQWHTVRCLRSANMVKIYVDGVLDGQRQAPPGKVVGNIGNSLPLTIGGKINCNQVTVSCDYFSGQIDYLKLAHN